MSSQFRKSFAADTAPDMKQRHVARGDAERISSNLAEPHLSRTGDIASDFTLAYPRGGRFAIAMSSWK